MQGGEAGVAADHGGEDEAEGEELGFIQRQLFDILVTDQL